MNLDNIIKQYDFNLIYAKALVKDVTEDQMTWTPATGLVNHPAFTIGHLVAGSADLSRDLGGSFSMKKDWISLFVRNGPGDPRTPDPNSHRYPSKKALIQELTSQHQNVKQLLVKLSNAELNQPIKWRFSDHMPTKYDLILFMCVNHEAMHLGQIAAWRRAAILESALASI